MWFWQRVLVNAINEFDKKGYSFEHTAEMNIVTTANKMDIQYDFYIRHNMHAVEWKLNTMITKSEILIINWIVIGDIFLLENLIVYLF